MAMGTGAWSMNKRRSSSPSSLIWAIPNTSDNAFLASRQTGTLPARRERSHSSNQGAIAPGSTAIFSQNQYEGEAEGRARAAGPLNRRRAHSPEPAHMRADPRPEGGVLLVGDPELAAGVTDDARDAWVIAVADLGKQ